MKLMQKYFLAIIPPDPYFSQVEMLKEELKEQFGIKYAMKSPAHITIKMPFSFDEKREIYLLELLSAQFGQEAPFDLTVSGIGNFGNRVIFLAVNECLPLRTLQSELRVFCRKQLHLVEELSDRNYTPHLTVAFKDLKPGRFEEVLKSLKKQRVEFTWSASEVCLLKKIDGKWKPLHFFPFGQKID
jgi:2'-5' RNA ligase